MKIYYCLCKVENKRPTLVEHSIGGGIHFLMDTGNRHAETVMRWNPHIPVESYDKGFTDQQLPLLAHSVFRGRIAYYLVDVVELDENGNIV